MASIEKVQERISQIATRRKNTTADEIDWVVSHLAENGFNVRKRPTKGGHGTLYAIESRKFHICTHNPGSKQVKPCYVDEFINAMIELGLYE
jgi:hypothetical protein